jgi:hypothetical protein
MRCKPALRFQEFTSFFQSNGPARAFPGRPQARPSLLVVAKGQVMIALDDTIANIALPST